MNNIEMLKANKQFFDKSAFIKTILDERGKFIGFAKKYDFLNMDKSDDYDREEVYNMSNKLTKHFRYTPPNTRKSITINYFINFGQLGIKDRIEFYDITPKNKLYLNEAYNEFKKWHDDMYLDLIEIAKEFVKPLMAITYWGDGHFYHSDINKAKEDAKHASRTIDIVQGENIGKWTVCNEFFTLRYENDKMPVYNEKVLLMLEDDQITTGYFKDMTKNGRYNNGFILEDETIITVRSKNRVIAWKDIS